MSGYIGTQPVPQATQTRDSFTATSGQTSFATGGYTPNFLDVYLNGVKLASADYTATNGSDVVLASGAATGDILEVVAFTTFNSASSSIDDNGNATAITIDSSENVLVGKATTAFGTAGANITSAGSAEFTRDSVVMNLNRLSTDGDIQRFYKDGTTVGSIGVNSNRLQIQSGSGGDLILGTGSNADAYRLSDAVFYPSVGDATADLGLSNRRFKDAYLSGGVYLGGTGSANYLEDYEEGLFQTAISSSGGGTVSMQSGAERMSYTKIGRQVTVTGDVRISSVSGVSGHTLISLPFSIGNYTDYAERGGFLMNVWTGSSWSIQRVFTSANTSYISVQIVPAAGYEYRVTFTYFTTS